MTTKIEDALNSDPVRAALLRCRDCWEDDGDVDVGRDKLDALTVFGFLRKVGRGRWEITPEGLALIGDPPPRLLPNWRDIASAPRGKHVIVVSRRFPDPHEAMLYDDGWYTWGVNGSFKDDPYLWTELPARPGENGGFHPHGETVRRCEEIARFFADQGFNEPAPGFVRGIAYASEAIALEIGDLAPDAPRAPMLRVSEGLSRVELDELFPVSEIEMVDISSGVAEPADPEYRIEADGFCADFPTRTAAKNFRGAFVEALLSAAGERLCIDPEDYQLLERMDLDNVAGASRFVVESDPDLWKRVLRLADVGFVAIEQVGTGGRLHITRRGSRALADNRRTAIEKTGESQ